MLVWFDGVKCKYINWVVFLARHHTVCALPRMAEAGWRRAAISQGVGELTFKVCWRYNYE